MNEQERIMHETTELLPSCIKTIVYDYCGSLTEEQILLFCIEQIIPRVTHDKWMYVAHNDNVTISWRPIPRGQESVAFQKRNLLLSLGLKSSCIRHLTAETTNPYPAVEFWRHGNCSDSIYYDAPSFFEWMRYILNLDKTQIGFTGAQLRLVLENFFDSKR